MKDKVITTFYFVGIKLKLCGMALFLDVLMVTDCILSEVLSIGTITTFHRAKESINRRTKPE